MVNQNEQSGPIPNGLLNFNVVFLQLIDVNKSSINLHYCQAVTINIYKELHTTLGRIFAFRRTNYGQSFKDGIWIRRELIGYGETSQMSLPFVRLPSKYIGLQNDAVGLEKRRINCAVFICLKIRANIYSVEFSRNKSKRFFNAKQDDGRKKAS